MGKTLRLALVPRDGLFFKDGRGWYTSHSGRGHALDWPWPSSIRGALCTAVGRRQEAEKGSIHCKKEWLALKDTIKPFRQLALRRELGKNWTRNHRMWPVPRDAVFLENNKAETKQCKVTRLIPKKPLAGILSNDTDADSALWFPVLETEDEESVKPLTPPRWWNEATFVKWLLGEDVTATIHQGKAVGPHMEKQARVHVVINNKTQTAKDEGLYTTEIVETLQRDKEGSYEWAIGVEVETPEVTAPRLATLGSDRRPAFVEELEDTQLFEPPDSLLEQIAGSKSLRLILITPAKFEEGWLPDGFERKDNVAYRGSLPGVNDELILRSALVGRPVNISGWDMAERRPKGTDRMVPPGSVYFFEKADGQAFTTDEVQALWLANLGDRAEDGFGLVVPGIWQNQGDAS